MELVHTERSEGANLETGRAMITNEDERGDVEMDEIAEADELKELEFD